MRLSDNDVLAQAKFHMENVRAHREKIKDLFIKTFMACLPDEELNLDLFNRMELVEKVDNGLNMKIVWELRYKNPKEGSVVKLQQRDLSGDLNP